MGRLTGRQGSVIVNMQAERQAGEMYMGVQEYGHADMDAGHYGQHVDKLTGWHASIKAGRQAGIQAERQVCR